MKKGANGFLRLGFGALPTVMLSSARRSRSGRVSLSKVPAIVPRQPEMEKQPNLRLSSLLLVHPCNELRFKSTEVSADAILNGKQVDKEDCLILTSLDMVVLMLSSTTGADLVRLSAPLFKAKSTMFSLQSTLDSIEHQGTCNFVPPP